MSDEFVLRHGTATTEKALGAAARVEVIVGKVMNRTKRAMSELDLEDLALLVQHVRDVSDGPRLEHTWTVAELLARAEAAEQRAGAASAEAIPGGPPGGRYRVDPCPIHNTVQIDLASGAQLCPHCVGDRSAWTVKVQRPSYHAVHVHLKEGAEATARERFWAEADRGSHVELLHGDRVVRSVQVDAEGRTLHLPTELSASGRSVEAKVEQLQAEVSALAARLGSSDASSQPKVAMVPRSPGALHRLSGVHPGAVIYRRYGGKQGDLGFAVDLALDPKTHYTRAFTLAKTFRVGTIGAGTGEGPVRPVEWWAAEGWDVLANLPVDARLSQDLSVAERWILDGGES